MKKKRNGDPKMAHDGPRDNLDRARWLRRKILSAHDWNSIPDSRILLQSVDEFLSECHPKAVVMCKSRGIKEVWELTKIKPEDLLEFKYGLPIRGKKALGDIADELALHKLCFDMR